MTHPENRTEDGVRIIIHAEGVLVRQNGQALSSTPEACGVIFHHPHRRRVFPSSDLMAVTGRELGVRSFGADVESSPG